MFIQIRIFISLRKIYGFPQLKKCSILGGNDMLVEVNDLLVGGTNIFV